LINVVQVFLTDVDHFLLLFSRFEQKRHIKARCVGVQNGNNEAKQWE